MSVLLFAHRNVKKISITILLKGIWGEHFKIVGVSIMAQQVNMMSMHEDVSSIPGLTQWIKDRVLLWLWHRPAAVGPIRPLAWEPP